MDQGKLDYASLIIASPIINLTAHLDSSRRRTIGRSAASCVSIPTTVVAPASLSFVALLLLETFVLRRQPKQRARCHRHYSPTTIKTHFLSAPVIRFTFSIPSFTVRFKTIPHKELDPLSWPVPPRSFRMQPYFIKFLRL